MKALRTVFIFIGGLLLVLGWLAAFAALGAGCAPVARTPLDPTTGRASVVEMAFSVQVAAEQCTANARHLDRFDRGRSQALYDACTEALIPARDAVRFVLPGLDPWTSASAAAVGCAGRAVRVGLEKTRAAFISAGYGGPLPGVLLDGIRLGLRVEPYALDTCDPLRPTTTSAVYEDPNIARVLPEYPR